MALLKSKKAWLSLLACSIAFTVTPVLGPVTGTQVYADDTASETQMQVQSSTNAAAPELTATEIAIPTPSEKPGRYTGSVSVTLSSSTPGAEIYYTQDGTSPDETSLKFDGNPIVLKKSTNLSVAAVKNGVWSKAATYGYIIKTEEKPLLKFVAMSDVHIGSRGTADPRYLNYFDTIESIFSKPDAILSIGDMINDNGNDKPNDHVMVREVFQNNLTRKNWTDIPVRMAIGNHDATVAKVKEHYPTEWFTSQPNGYYESVIGGYHFFFLNGNNYNWDASQRNWLKGRLAELAAIPENKNKPIFIGVHQPVSGTVMDGLQASNPNLYADLKDYPQAIVLSGHSHFNINDERSIHQKDFTSINLGSMSYVESERGYMQSTEKGLVGRFEMPISQAQFIEVYEDRVEVDRITMNADSGDVYDDWQPVPPYTSQAVSAGKKWVIELKGNTNEEIKSNFKYTTRNKTSPVFSGPIEVATSDDVPVLRFTQAKDDQNTHHYEVNLLEQRSGAVVKSLKVLSDFYFSPIPNKMSIKLEGLEPATPYTVLVTAVDSYGNRSATLQQSFKTGGSAPEPTPIDHETMWKELVVDMKFDDNLNDDAKDVTGMAIVNGKINYVPGKSNKAVQISAGNSNSIDLGNRDDLKVGSGDFTVSFWHTGDLAGDQTIISNKNWNSGKNVGWYIGPAVANSMTINASDGTNRSDTRAESVGNEWHLFTVTMERASQTAKVYVDGVEKAKGTIAAPAGNSLDSYNIHIGTDGNKGNGGANVTMDELKIWKRALTATEVKALSDSYKTVKLYTFEQLTELIGQADQFQTKSGNIIGVSYPADKLKGLADQLTLAKAITAESEPAVIDGTYIDLMRALKEAQDSVI